MLKLNLGCGKKRLKGFDNLDKRYGWDFKNGLSYDDDSIDAITISHSLMYLTIEELNWFLGECWRVLKRGSWIRITEDNTEDPESDTYKTGWKNEAKCLTGPKQMRESLEDAGFDVYDVSPEETNFIDKTLIQQFHGDLPRVFHIEGKKI